MGQFGWDFIAQGAGYSSHTRDRLQRPITANTRDRLQRPITAIADGNGGGGIEGWWWNRRGGPNSKEGEMEARVQRDRLYSGHKGQAIAAMAIADGNGSGGI